jgi:hypothetical protein
MLTYNNFTIIFVIPMYLGVLQVYHCDGLHTGITTITDNIFLQDCDGLMVVVYTYYSRDDYLYDISAYSIR